MPIDSSHIARTEICIVRDHPPHHRFFEVVILHPDLDRWIASHRYLGGGNSKIFYFHLYFGEDFHFHLYFFKWVGSTTNYIDTYFFHFCFLLGFPRLVHVEFWYAWYRNRRWKTLLNRLPWEKLTASWRLQECDNLKSYGGLL